ncbi:MAG TPA: hypothetical protein PKL99_06130 [Syntrophales bacterium]|nr:hypothetical protein [Syntrophales bacterium]
MKKKPRHLWNAAGIAGFLLLPLIFMPATVEAHRPASIALAYEAGAGKLTVTVTHRVSNPDRHYVESIRIWKNGAPAGAFSYKSQPDKDGVTYTYDIPANEGDILKVEGACSVYGKRSAELTVTAAGSGPEGSAPVTGK